MPRAANAIPSRQEAPTSPTQVADLENGPSSDTQPCKSLSETDKDVGAEETLKTEAAR